MPNQPAAPPVKDGRRTFDAAEVDEVFGNQAKTSTEAFIGTVKNEAPPVPQTVPPTPAPSTEPAPGQEPTDESNAAAPAPPEAGTTPAGAETTPPPAAAPTETPSAPEPAVIPVAAVADIIKAALEKKAEAPQAPPPSREPPHIVQARQILALTEDQYNELYDKFIEAKEYRKAESLSALRVNAPYHIHNYEKLEEMRLRSEQSLAAAQTVEAKAQIEALDKNPETKDWKQYRKTMARLAQNDEAAVAAGLEPAFGDVVSLYRAAKVMQGSQVPPLAPGARSAKENLASGTPAPRGGPAVPPNTPPKRKGDDFVDELFASEKPLF